ncbi:MULTISPECIES: hypothetical protein [Acinetobacter]|uniref:hypothetical protein n=1 Tax=Acinetobacter TaxID=469 RepID=UPI00141AF858|nr:MULTISPECIES: hypothetical protein [Acinetobacter]MCS4298241.1 hypothetical protein [Acinetobacter guillouiae]MCW2251845.1 hypothetical protein [Acinetobacter sp. BIGb0204]NII38499.1 hypothetical protein [Acinetobacter sp. BIGb0196]
MNLNYPIVIKSNKYIEGNILNERNLIYVGENNFINGCFNNSIIIDSSGYEYKILSAKKEKLIFSIWNLFPQYRSIKVSLELSKPKKKNLDEIKKELTELFLNNPKWFKNSDFSQTQAIELFINEARTVKELIKNISVWS